MQNWLWSVFVFPVPPSLLLLTLHLQKALAMCVLSAQQNLRLKSPSRPVLAVAVLFTVAVLVSPPTGKQATSTRASPNELLSQLKILDFRAHLKHHPPPLALAAPHGPPPFHLWSIEVL